MADDDPVILGENDNTATRATRVRNTSPGIGLHGEGRQGVFGLGQTGVWGQGIAAPGRGIGVLGEAEDGTGVVGIGQGHGLGVSATGFRAPIRLTPWITAGAPTSGRHERGEMMVDRKGDLYLCKRGGTPGTWALIG
jgi:hypothetical protein